MDEPDMAMKKGMVLTMDALFALALLLLSSMLMIMFLSRPPSYQSSGAEAAGDLVAALKSMNMSDLDNNPRYPYANYIYDSNLSSRSNGTVAEAIADLYLNGRTEAAMNLSQELLEPAVPSDYGVELLLEAGGPTDCEEVSSNFSCVFSSPRIAVRNFVYVGRHFIYYNNVTREMRLVIYK